MMTESRIAREPIRGAEESRPVGVSHEERAKMRMAEIRAEIGDGDLYNNLVDKFYAEAPAGWVYNWKTFSVFNKEYPQYIARLKKNFWTPVPASRHRELLYDGYSEEIILIDGMILMERPKEINDRITKMEHDEALYQVRQSEAKLKETPDGTAPRGAHPYTRAKLSAQVGPAEIPD